jgi:hypothetical protein
MFERYTEKARRIIFFARYESSQFGTPSIETEHILLGIFREDKALANRFLPSSDSAESIRQRIRALTPVRERISTSVDLPLSHESKRVLAYSAEEADTLKHAQIGPEHLLLGLLREEKCLAANLLQERGLTIAGVRDDLRVRGASSTDSPHNVLQSNLLKYLESLPLGLDIQVAEPGLCISTDPATPPFLFIEILSPAARFGEVRKRAEQQLANGMYVWLLDPNTRDVYTATPEAGLQEFKGEVLRTENPVLELPLAQVFA